MDWINFWWAFIFSMFIQTIIIGTIFEIRSRPYMSEEEKREKRDEKREKRRAKEARKAILY